LSCLAQDSCDLWQDGNQRQKGCVPGPMNYPDVSFLRFVIGEPRVYSRHIS